MSKWIKCIDSFPDDYEDVLVSTKTVGVKIGYITDYMRKYKKPAFNVGGHSREADSWMPLPEPPK
ncbi:MAG: DUF551 domain-containing protein [Oleispira sp.]